MPSFSKSSKRKLETCHVHLILLFEEVVREIDCTILEGQRDKETQNRLYTIGRTKVKFPHSRHNDNPSYAVDVAPYPIDWNDLPRFYYFGGFVKGMANRMGITIRWGGDWDSDNSFKDQSFNDLVHFELLTKEETKKNGGKNEQRKSSRQATKGRKRNS